MTAEDRRREFVERLSALLDEFQDMTDDIELPVITDWVIVIAIDDGASSDSGSLVWFHPPQQWRHRSIGLLTSATDGARRITSY